MAKTKINWCDVVWNPVVGCRKVSAGCKNCYAEKMACRLAAMGRPEYLAVVEGGHWTGNVDCLPERLDDPLKWKKPRRVFVNSMSDLFHGDVPASFIRDVFRTMARCHWHTYIILTKREKRMARLINIWSQEGFEMLPNVWLGVSVEDQKSADERIPWLLRTKAAVRVVSVEPMLEKVYLNDIREWDAYKQSRSINALLDGENHLFWRDEHPRIDWVICGCESGLDARPAELDWFRSLRDQCVGAGVPFFLKQANIGNIFTKMPALDGRVWDQYPAVNNG